MPEFVRLEVADGVGTIRLDRPKMNALNVQMQGEIRDAATEAAEREDVRAVVLYGGERTFAAGVDIKEMAEMSYVDMVRQSGPLQAAFTNPEVKEIGEMPGADVVVRPEDVQLDPLSQAELDAAGDRMLSRKVEILQGYAIRPLEGKPKRLHVRFLVSPVELLGDEQGRVRAMRLVRNRLIASASGGISAEATGEFEELEVGLVFRSVGYRGVALPGLPGTLRPL
jgi:hypothetical protein